MGELWYVQVRSQFSVLKRKESPTPGGGKLHNGYCQVKETCLKDNAVNDSNCRAHSAGKGKTKEELDEWLTEIRREKSHKWSSGDF